jgi:uncharacterized small protein (DUF1192 family)
MKTKGKHYGHRDIVELDQRGNYFGRHVSAMTEEGLHSKSDIAAELAWRDAEIDRLKDELANAGDHRACAQKVTLLEADCATLRARGGS